MRPAYLSDEHAIARHPTRVGGRQRRDRRQCRDDRHRPRDAWLFAKSGTTRLRRKTMGSPGDDVFSVTTYAGAGATGAVLSVGTVQKQIDSGGGTCRSEPPFARDRRGDRVARARPFARRSEARQSRCRRRSGSRHSTRAARRSSVPAISRRRSRCRFKATRRTRFACVRARNRARRCRSSSRHPASRCATTAMRRPRRSRCKPPSTGRPPAPARTSRCAAKSPRRRSARSMRSISAATAGARPPSPSTTVRRKETRRRRGRSN